MDDDAKIQDHTDSTAAGTVPPAGDVPAVPTPEDLPARLRVHSLARVLGTTSRRVLDALAEFDGRSRSAHSSVDRTDAVKVRDVLAAAEAQAAAPAAEAPVVSEPVLSEPAAPEPAATESAATESAQQTFDVVPSPTEGSAPEELAVEAEPVLAGEPESRLLIETPARAQDEDTQATVADYLPLFVAPQPVQSRSAVQRDVRIDRDERDDRDEHDGDDDERDDTDTSAEDDGDDTDDEQAEKPANRRRRRGRRGRGRGRGGEAGADGDGESDDDNGADDEGADDEGAEDNGAVRDEKTTNRTRSRGKPKVEAETSDDEDDSSDEDGDDEDGAGDGSSRRRRRRRRRKSGSADDAEPVAPDDPPNTVVHERAPRSKAERAEKANNEIQGISGSTRLEAKRQRRRDGRDAGRRRPPILSEAEFLARREAVERVMVVRDSVRTEPPHSGSRYTQIAVLEDGVVVEHFVTSQSSASLVGNIYLGIVQNVLPSMEAAFVDIGRGRNGVLYAGEVNWEAAGLGGAQRKIEQALKPGDYVVVQVSKDPVGHKGARLTTQVSLAGRYLVYVPGASSTGISRKLPDTERQRLKEILREVVPSDAGVIIRTASEGVKEEDIRGDVTRLQERWNEIDARAAETRKKASGAAIALYEEPDVLVKVIRDLFNEDFSGLIVSGDTAWGTIDDYVSSVAPELMSKLTKYEGTPDVFAVHRIDEQLTKALDRKVWLPSGGTLVIDRTEAMTVVDVNTGKFTGAGGNLEQTVTKNNLEAAEEIVRQLRLRDIGGMIVIDFIDMVLESNRDLVLRRLTEALARDRTRHQVSEVTSLGLVQLTRKKLGTGLIEAFSTTCTHCAGRGIVLHSDPVDSGPPAPPRKAAESNSGAAAGSGSTSGGRRGKRSRKGRADEPEVEAPAVAKLPPHVVGEHPMFKAMAAANGRPDGEHDEDADGNPTQDLSEDVVHEAVGEERADDAGVAEHVVGEVVEEDLDDEDFEESDESEDDEDDSDEDDSDEDDADEDDSDVDDEIVVVDLDDDDDDSDDDDDEDDEVDEDDDDDDSDDDEDDEDDDEDDPDDEPEPVVEVIQTVRPRRRRAAARPAGPPVT